MLCLLAVLLALLPACQSAPVKDLSFRCSGSWFIPPSFHGNPFAQGGDGSHLPFIFEQPFVYFPANDRFEPQLALKSELSADRRTQTLTLRQGVSWHDGQPLSAQDFKTTFLLYWLQGWGGGLEALTVTQPDQLLVKWRKPANFREERELLIRKIQAPDHLYRKWAEQAEVILRQLSAIPLENASPAQNQRKEALLAQKADVLQQLYQFRPELPVGTNAYQLEKVTASELVLRRYAGSWHKQVKVPKVRILRGSSNDVLWAYTLGGDIDASHSATPQDVVEQILKLNPHTRFISLPDYIGYGYALNQKVAPLSDRVFRQALAHLLNQDVQRMIASYYSLTSDTYHLPIMNQYAKRWLTPDFYKGLSTYPFDPQKAEQLLSQAGYQRNPSGQWLNPQQQPLQLEIAAISGYSDWVLASEAFATRLSQFGIPTQVRTYDAALYFQLLQQGKLQMAAAFGFDFKMFPHPASTLDRFFSQAGMIAKASGVNPFATLPSGERVELQKLVEEVVNSADPQRVAERIQALNAFANRELLFLGVYEKQLGVFILDGERVKGWPAADDPRWSLNAVGMDTVYAYFLSSGMLEAVTDE